MDQEEIRDSVRAFVLSELLEGEDPENLHDDTPLITGGVLDPVDTIQLITYLQEAFEIELDGDEVSPEHLNTLERIAETVSGKLG